MTYQTVFPRGIEFLVAPVPDKGEITKENWFLDEEKIKKVMGEVEKIGKYFAPYIKKFHEE